MTRYPALLGKRVEVAYRLGTIYLLASGLLIAESGESIFVQQHFEQHGSVKTCQLKIPYHCIVRLSESIPDRTSAAS